jgi:branched-chain amino acid transport system permease protein
MALGFSLVYGVSRLPNFAHGALYVLTGYIAWLLINRAHLSYPLAILLSLLCTGIIGAAMYHLILVRVRGMPISEIIASYAIGLAILEGLRWGGLKGGTIILRPFVEGSVDIFGTSVDFQRIIVVLGGAILFGLLWLFVNKSKLGLALKGMAQDERAALTLGIDSDRMAVVAMGLGSALAGAAGLILLPLGTRCTSYNNMSGRGLQVEGQLDGAIMAAFLIGFAQILTETYFGAHYKIVVALCAIILALILRPSGLFGRQKELEERV